jgi:predicted signal transduction protein with EAL and GGDEF domain
VDGEVTTAATGAAPGRSLLVLPRQFWATRHPAASGPAVAPRARTQRVFSASRLIVLLALVAVGVTGLSAAIGYGLARQSDERLLTEQRASLRNAIVEFRMLFGQADAIDPRFVRMVEQSASLQNLRFEAEPSPGVREMQTVIDAHGRITGFFTWDKTRPMTLAMNRMMPFIGGVAIALVGFGGFSLGQLRRARRELSASEDQARRAAEEDPLTGLPNRRKMLGLLQNAMTARIGQKPLTFALFELSGLHEIDEEIGMIRREEYLADAVMNTKDYLPPNATLGRMGTTEFAVICDGDVDMRTTLRSMIHAVGDLHRSDTDARLGAHAGYAQVPRDATGADELVRRARLALHAAGKKGSGVVTAFDPSIDAMSKDRQFIRREMPRAVATEAFELHYQPIVASEGSRIVGVEALLRWNHPERGAIGPAVFVPVAEQMGLIDRLGAFVLRRALTEAKRWPDLYVSVNLSPLQVRDPGIVDLIRDMLAESGVAPARLMLEITEGVLIDNPDEMLKRIEDLHALGVNIALDDFGSGYSNLGYLQRFPFDKLKIDKSFVSALGHSANGGVIIQAIVALGRALDLKVVVEGVETEQQRVLLRLAGCDEMQGYLFAKPAPAKAIDRLLAQAKQGNGRAMAAAETLTA